MKLKACPFCGKKPHSIPRGVDGSFGWVVGCASCDLHLWGDAQDDTEEKWNNRPIEDALQTSLTEAQKTIATQAELIRKWKEDAEYWLSLAISLQPKTGVLPIRESIQYEKHTALMNKLESEGNNERI